MADWRRVARITVRSLLGAGVVFAALWIYYGEGGIRDSNRLSATFREQEREIARRVARKAELTTHWEALKRGDRDALELAARKYGLVGSNEYLWKVVPQPAESTQN